jgi:DNA-3-methyladenine glycosylase I
MNEPKIIRTRAKIVATRVFCEMQERGEDFSSSCWSLTNGDTIPGNGRRFPTQTELSTRIPKVLKRRGLNFVSPVIVYAWMQAVGIVSDHANTCFRRREIARAAKAAL